MVKLNISLVCLPFTVPYTNTQKSEGQNKRIARRDAATYFILLCQTAQEAEQVHAQRSSEGPVQPYVVVIGQVTRVERCYVRFQDIVLDARDSIVRGVDLCFKLLFVLNLEYSPQCANVWLVVQQLLYGITVSGQNIVASSLTAINQIQHNKKVAPEVAPPPEHCFSFVL